MWPGCNQCGATVPNLDDPYCGGNRCKNLAYKPFGKGITGTSSVDEKKHRAKNKAQRQNRKRGRK